MLSAASQEDPPIAAELIGPIIDGLPTTLVALWPVWLLIGGIGAAKLAWRLWKRRRLRRSGIDDVGRMDGTTFEHFLSTLFRRLGYRVEHTGRRGDYGADLVIAKAGQRSAVQAKRWNKAIGVKAVQEAVASKGMYGCSEALVVANRAFTRQARVLAQANGVTLWDREVLVEKLLAVGDMIADAPTPALAGPAAANESRSPRAEAGPRWHCARCGAAVSEKVREYCLVRPNRFGGQIYCFKHQRGRPLASRTP